MPRFVTDRDVEFFKNVTKELVDVVIETPVILYKLNIQDSSVNIYGESNRKQYWVGTRLTCLIDRQNQQSTADTQVVDTTQSAAFNFLRQSLQDKQVYPETGDIIEFHGGYYEINNVVENQLVAGQPYFNYTIRCEAHLTRRSAIELDEPQQ